MNIIVVEPPEVLPVSLSEIYAFLHLDVDGSTHPDDELLTELIEAATEKVEAETNRALVKQTIRLVMPSFITPQLPIYLQPIPVYAAVPAGIELKRPPFLELLSVKYVNSDGTEETVDAAGYYVTSDSLVPTLHTAGSWPTVYSRQDAVRIEYRVGYPPRPGTPEDLTSGIPKALKLAVKMEVQLKYESLSPEKQKQLEASIARTLGQFYVASFS